MLLFAFYLSALMVSGAQSSLFSSTEDLKTVTKEHKTFVADLHQLIDQMENDLAYAKRFNLKQFCPNNTK
jgi:hypothetical protein